MKHQDEIKAVPMDARRRKFLSSTSSYAFLASLRGAIPVGAVFFEMAEAFAATEAEKKAQAEHVMLLGGAGTQGLILMSARRGAGVTGFQRSAASRGSGFPERRECRQWKRLCQSRPI